MPVHRQATPQQHTRSSPKLASTHLRLMKYTAQLIKTFHSSSDVHTAFDVFDHLLQKGIKPNIQTYTTLFSLCGEVVAVEKGKLLHQYLVDNKVELDIMLATALIYFYGNCGDVTTAKLVFDNCLEHLSGSIDISAWNAIIGAFGLNGQGVEAVQLFRRVQKDPRVEINSITVMNVLTACSHNKLVDQALEIYNEVSNSSDVTLNTIHQNCIVDVLGRAGQLEAAERFIANMDVFLVLTCLFSL
jgi:pentatricopeptide repeat protein